MFKPSKRLKIPSIQRTVFRRKRYVLEIRIPCACALLHTMEKQKRSLHLTTKAQFNIHVLVEGMKVTPQLAPNFGANRDQLHQHVDLKLNSLVPPTRIAPEWKKIWIDLNNRTKNGIGEIRGELVSTNGGPNSFVNLAQILHLGKSAVPSGCVFGVGNVTIRRANIEQPIGAHAAKRPASQPAEMLYDKKDEEWLQTPDPALIYDEPQDLRLPSAQKRGPKKSVYNHHLSFLQTQISNQTSTNDTLQTKVAASVEKGVAPWQQIAATNAERLELEKIHEKRHLEAAEALLQLGLM